MKVSKRIITFFLAVAMLFSLFTFAAASSSFGLLVDSASVTSWNSWFSENGGDSSDYWTKINSLFSCYAMGSYESYDDLASVVFRMDSRSEGTLLFVPQIYKDFFGERDYIVMYDNALQVYRPYDNNTHLWLVNSAGHFPYYREPSDSGSGGSSGDNSSCHYFQSRGSVLKSTVELVLSKDALERIAEDHSGYVSESGSLLVIVDKTGSQILCSPGDRPVAYPKEPEKTAAGNSFEYYIKEGDTTNNYFEYQGGDTFIREGDIVTNINNNQTYNNNTTNVYEDGDTYNQQFIDGDQLNIFGDYYNIESMLYDASTHTYNLTTNNGYTYNSTTNQYETNLFTFQITYDIHYTSITYIGQTEEFEAETYVYYYELPDGRSSADLTAEELEQLSLAFTDVVNYARSTDSTDMRVLYHFDGNTEDSSYWSYCTEFDWVKGASLTYMDEGVFNGSLYLDETEHEFTITLPNKADLYEDFTIQFRYYQSHTLSPVKDSYIALGGEPRLYFSGSQFITAAGVVVSSTSIGTWNEICIMRRGRALYYYVNGVCCFETTLSKTYSNTITFHFGSEQQTYKKIDELRVTRAAVYPGTGYTPSAVPHDTNLTLILPDGERPLADEVMVLHPSDNNLLSAVGLSDWSDISVVSNVETERTGYGNYMFNTRGDIWFYQNGCSFVDNGTSVGFSTSATGSLTSSSTQPLPQNCIFIPITECDAINGNPSDFRNGSAVLDFNQPHCLTVVYSDGTYSNLVFYWDDAMAGFEWLTSGSSVLTFKPLEPYRKSGSYYYRTFGIALYPTTAGKQLDIVHMELVEGSSPQFEIGWETAIYSSGELEDSPVLAVRSNTPISTYTFGGVRPTYPERGQVWAMIEGHRIVSLQQYTGSAWVEVDGRIWTGSRWIPYSSFDVFTLQDCWDIVDSGEDSDYEYIYSESGFWAWIQKALLKIMDKLDAIITLLGGDPENLPGGSSGNDQDQTFWQRVKGIFENALAKILEALLDLITKVLDLVLGMVYDLLEFFFGLLTDAVVDGIGGFFDALTDEALLQFFRSEEPLLDEYGQPVVDANGDQVMVSVVAIPAGVAGVFAFISATIMVLPIELRSVLFFGVGALLLLAVLKLIKA